jgi:AcrR family transcriptional regulator
MATRRPKPPKPPLHEKIADKLEKAARKQEQAAEKLQTKLDQAVSRQADAAKVLHRVAEQVGALDLWTRPGPGARSPRFTRADIARAAMRIADTEGFAAVSMRRIAAELDAGTMTLYHYVRTKDELLTLLTDAVMGEVVVPDTEPFPTHWREALILLAERSRAAFRRHPWILDIADDPPIGPNSVRHFDQSLQAVSSLELDLAEKLDIVSVVDEYTFGYCLQERNNLHDAGPSDAEMIAYVEDLIATGHYPQIEAIAKRSGLHASWSRVTRHLRDPERFRRNLDRLLDGIEAGFNR